MNNKWEEARSILLKEINSDKTLAILKEKIAESHDRNLNGFHSITHYKTEKVIQPTLWHLLEKYERYFKKKESFNKDKKLLYNIHNNIKHIKKAWLFYQKQDIDKAVKEIGYILKKYIDDPFIVSELEKSYALKQLAYMDDINGTSKNYGKDYQKDYEQLKLHPITLFRGRWSALPLTDRKELLHQPYSRKPSNNKFSRKRFVCKGIPALYLGNTSYVCWLECSGAIGQDINKIIKTNPDKDFYVSAYIPEVDAKKLRILNLIDVEELINGIYTEGIDDVNSRNKALQDKLISFFPLVLATSFKRENSRKKDFDYIIPELLMRVIKKNNIDGIAYLSKHLDHDLRMLVGVNIVIPIYNNKLASDGRYGSVCKMFKMTEPELFDISKEEIYGNVSGGSYMCDYCKKAPKGVQLPTLNKTDGGQQYDKSVFGKFDDYLVNQEFSVYD